MMHKVFDNLKLTEMQQNMEILLKEIKVRLKFLADVGLDYLTLSETHQHYPAVKPENSFGDSDRLQTDRCNIYS